MYQLEGKSVVRETDLSGIIAASLTPVTDRFEIDTMRLAEHVAGLLEQGCRFVSTFGTTGEGASFSVDQKIAALDELAELGVDMTRQAPGVMSPDLDGAARMYSAISRHKCRAAVVLPPFYYGCDREGVLAFYDALFERAVGADTGVILYNIPKLSRVLFDGDLVEALVAKHGSRIVGLKDSTGNRDAAVEFAERFPDLSIFVGDDRVLPDLLKAGGAGLIGGMPNIFARDLVALFISPTGPDAEGLSAAAKARIEAVGANGDLVALKGMLAHYRNDPEWRRVLPPLLPLSAEAQGVVEWVFASSGYPDAESA